MVHNSNKKCSKIEKNMVQDKKHGAWWRKNTVQINVHLLCHILAVLGVMKLNSACPRVMAELAMSQSAFSMMSFPSNVAYDVNCYKQPMACCPTNLLGTLFGITNTSSPRGSSIVNQNLTPRLGLWSISTLVSQVKVLCIQFAAPCRKKSS